VSGIESGGSAAAVKGLQNTDRPSPAQSGAPGNYLELLTRIQGYLRPRTYVEIGLGHGRSFVCVPEGTLAVGIDPALKIREIIRRPAALFALTSDEFFDRYDLQQILGGLSVDLAFIDGMHRFEFALRDFIHLERCCAPESVILIHDCYPVDEQSASREPRPGVWSGDIWKLIVCLKEHRQELNIAVVTTPPTGLAIVTGLDSGSTVLEERYDDICRHFIPLDYGSLETDKEEQLNAVSSDWNLVERLLPRPFPDAETAAASA
jgi:hypothetical protein